MTNFQSRWWPGNRLQRGAAAVEFALIVIVFLTLLLGIIEFGRFLYLWNTVQEVTRRAAREAVVCRPIEKERIKCKAVFRDCSADFTGTLLLPAGAGVSNRNVRIRYLDATGVNSVTTIPDAEQNIINCEASSTATDCIRFVEASVCQPGNDQSVCTDTDHVTYQLMIPFVPIPEIPIPFSKVVMPAESLGYGTPAVAGSGCILEE